MSDLWDSGMFVRDAAWHQKGNVIDEAPEDWSAVRTKGDLWWDPFTTPMLVPLKGGGIEKSEKHALIMRSDDWRLLGVCSDRYQVVTNRTLGNVIETMLAVSPNMKYDAVCSLDEGRLVTATMLLDEPWKSHGDASQTFPMLTVINYNDGSGGLRLFFNAIRVVCRNTASMAMRAADRHGHQIKFAHTKQLAERDWLLDKARSFITSSMANTKEYQEVMNTLARRAPISPDTFLRAWLPMPKRDFEWSDQTWQRKKANVMIKRAHFDNLLETDTVTDKDNLYQQYQAALEADQHLFRVRGIDARAKRGLMGGSDYSSKALKVALSLV